MIDMITGIAIGGRVWQSTRLYGAAPRVDAAPASPRLVCTMAAALALLCVSALAAPIDPDTDSCDCSNIGRLSACARPGLVESACFHECCSSFFQCPAGAFQRRPSDAARALSAWQQAAVARGWRSTLAARGACGRFEVKGSRVWHTTGGG